MPQQLTMIAEAIRAQLLALAPDSARAQIEGLPAVALLGAVGVIALILLWIVFAALGAMFGGGRRRREQEVADELQSRRAELREPPPAPRAPPPPPPPQPDRRMDERRRDERRTPPPPLPPPPSSPPLPPAGSGGADLARRYDELMARGDSQAQGNDFQGAFSTFKSALDVARQIAFDRPDSVDAQRRVAKALHKVGDLGGRLGEGHAARQAHEQALVLLRRVYVANQRDATVARELAVTLERLGAAAAAASDRVGARNAFEEELGIASAMSQQERGDMSWVRFMAVVHVMIGNLNDEDSRAHYEQARQLFEQVERAGQIQDADRQTLTQLRGVLQG